MTDHQTTAIVAAILRASPSDGSNWSLSVEDAVDEADAIVALAKKKWEHRTAVEAARSVADAGKTVDDFISSGGRLPEES